LIWLYRAPFSTNVERVSLALAHKGLGDQVTDEVIDYEDRSAVIDVSGQELIPVIDDDGEVVFDSLRILRHLDERYPDPPLFPAEPGRRAEMDVFCEWFNEVWKTAPNSIEIELEGGEPMKDVVDDAADRMQASLDVFEAMLDGREFLMGDRLSAADCIAFPFVKYASVDPEPGDDELFHRILAAHQQPGDDHPRVVAWIERVNALPRV
jgi:glutathione S-transferase